MQNYYEMIATKQDAQLRPILEKLLPVIAMSVWGAVPDDLDFEFNSVHQPDDKELTDLAKNGSDSVIAVYNAGLVSQQTALRELKQQSVKTGIWTNITDEDIEKANSELEQLPEEGEMSGGMDGIEMQKASATDFNPFHDKEDGRFAEANKGGGFNTLGDKLNREKVNKRIAEIDQEEDTPLNANGEEFLGEEIPNVKGYEAIKALLGKKRGHVKGAFNVKGLGLVDLVWGNESGGLCHISAKHLKEFGTPEKQEKFLKKLCDTIERGTLSVGKNGHFIVYDGNRDVIIKPFLNEHKLNWIVSGFGSFA